MRTMHLFAGVGGGLLADLILGHNPIIAVEWDSYACQVLRERAKDGWFPDLSVWEGDVRLFDPSEYAGRVDCIHAGFPCQDISVAGNQSGVGHETRSGLYREVLRIAGIVRPRYLFLENVSAILGNGLGTVLADLAAMGFSAEWGCIRASDCGAPHHRDRWFLLANAGHKRVCERREPINAFKDVRESCGICGDGLSRSCWKESDVLADSRHTKSQGRNEDKEGVKYSERRQEWSQSASRCHVADVYGAQRQGEQRQERITTEYSDTCCASWWEIEPELGRVADGVSNRVHRLKGLGNAQVPLQAAVAWRLLGGE